MYNALSIQVTAVFLLLVVFLLLGYLWKRLGCNRHHIPVPANLFLILFSAAFIISGVFTLFLGFSNALLAIALGTGIVISLLHPVVAVCFLVANLFMRPWEMMGYNSLMVLMPRLLASVTFFSWLLYSFRTHKHKLVWNVQCVFFVGLLLWLVLAGLFSGNMGEGLNFFISSFFPVIVICILIINAVSDSLDIEALRSVLIASVTAVIATAMVTNYAEFGTAIINHRLTGPGLWGNSNDLAALIAFILPFCLLPLFLKNWSIKSKTIFIVCSAVFLLGLWLSQSRGAVLALLACGVAYFFIHSKQKSRIWVSLLFILCLPLILFSGIHRESSDLEGSEASRWNYVIAGLGMVKSQPVFGVGLNRYPELYELYTPAFHEWGERTAHSSWVLVMAEAGLMGLFLFIGLYLSTLIAAWRIRKRYPEFFLAMISYGVAMSFLSHTYIFLPYLLFVFVVAAGRVYGAEAESSGRRLKIRFRTAAWLPLLFLLPIQQLEAEQKPVLRGVFSADKPLGNSSPKLKSIVKLEGSRGEDLNFLIKVKSLECGTLDMSQFRHERTGDKITLPIVLYEMPYITTDNPSYPGAYVGRHYDPLIAIKNRESCPADKTENEWWVWGELAIPKEAKPGQYKAVLNFSNKAELPLRVEVWNMQIPEKPSFPAYAELTTWYNLLGHYGEWGPNEGELAKKYTSAMREHRIYPLKNAVTRPPVFQSNDKLLLNIEDHPTRDDSFYSVAIKDQPEWAYLDFPTVGGSGTVPIDWAKAGDYFVAIENTIAKIDRVGKAMVYLWDEPKKEAIDDLKRLAKLVKKHAPSLKVMVTSSYRPELADYVDIFVPIMDYYGHHKNSTIRDHENFKKSGGEVWWYVSCMSHGCNALYDSGAPDFVIDRPATYIRSIPWLASRYSIDAFLYYSVNNGFQYYPHRDPWHSLWDFWGNGDGTLFYPGRPDIPGIDEHTPVPSIRLKLWREASFDAEYLNWMNNLKEKPEWWEREMAKRFQSTLVWEKNYEKYKLLRSRIGRFLNERYSS